MRQPWHSWRTVSLWRQVSCNQLRFAMLPKCLPLAECGGALRLISPFQIHFPDCSFCLSSTIFQNMHGSYVILLWPFLRLHCLQQWCLMLSAVTWSCCWLCSTAKDLLRAVLRAFMGATSSYTWRSLNSVRFMERREGKGETAFTESVRWSGNSANQMLGPSSLHITAKFHRSMTGIVFHVCAKGRHFCLYSQHTLWLKFVIHAPELTEQ